MKKIISSIIIFIILIICVFLIKPNTNKTNKIKVAEVTHSPFYAPWYVAIEKGYFKDYNLDIEVILTSGANNVIASVLSGDVQIGLCGPEATIYVYNENKEDYIKTFAGLTKRDGQFIVSRKKEDNFTLDKLINKEVLAGRIGGMPELNFENALKNNNIKTNKVNINTSVDYASLSSAFIGGVGDYVNLFEPNATILEKQGYGYIVGMIGKYSGTMPYTAFNAKKSYIKNNKEIIKSFRNAINKGLKYVSENDSKTIAKTITNQFPDITLNDLTTIIERYKTNDSWFNTTYIDEESFNNLQNIMINSKQIDEYVDYNKLIINK